MFEVDGLVNQVLRLFGFQATTGWISDPKYALWTIILLHVWTFGSPMVIFLAGLRQIPGMYYEAASVDGASAMAPLHENHFAAAVTDHLLQPGAADHRCIPGLHPSLCGLERNRRPVGLDACSTRCTCTSEDSASSQMGYAAAMAWLLLVDHRGFHRDQLLLSQSIGCSTVTDLQTHGGVAPPSTALMTQPPAPQDAICHRLAGGGPGSRSVLKHIRADRRQPGDDLPAAVDAGQLLPADGRHLPYAGPLAERPVLDELHRGLVCAVHPFGALHDQLGHRGDRRHCRQSVCLHAGRVCLRPAAVPVARRCGSRSC